VVLGLAADRLVVAGISLSDYKDVRTAVRSFRRHVGVGFEPPNGVVVL